MKLKYSLVIAELYNSTHGIDENSSDNIQSHILCVYRSHKKDKVKEISSSNSLLNNIKNNIRSKTLISCIYDSTYKHDIIRNYHKVSLKLNKIHIGEVFYLEKGQECVVVLKTIWLKIIQRCWRKIYKLREKIKKERIMYNTIFNYSQIYTKPKYPNYLPSIRGMYYYSSS
jgi:hypothetical protein